MSIGSLTLLVACHYLASFILKYVNGATKIIFNLFDNFRTLKTEWGSVYFSFTEYIYRSTFYSFKGCYVR